MKRIFSILLCAAMFASLLLVPVVASETAQAECTGEHSPVKSEAVDAMCGVPGRS